ncbi:MAG: transcription-repair coupling factor, partial [Proteobacteria bacterium]|nr:transcription-repair coupling factor [Pseudomonadota bacterium]
MNWKPSDITEPGRRTLGGAPEGVDIIVAAELAAAGKIVTMVMLDDAAMDRRAEAAALLAPELETVALPAWDCLPYDRVSPRRAILGRRLAALGRVVEPASAGRLVLTTVSAVLQRVPPRAAVAGAGRRIGKGTRLAQNALTGELERFGFARVETVTEPGEYAVRGGIVDLYPAGAGQPVRLDFFGDDIDTLRVFDPATQRSTGDISAVVLTPVSEAPLDKDAIVRFRSGYRKMFGHAGDDDPLYESVSEGRRHPGFEHWLPLYHDRLETLFDYLSDAVLMFDHQADAAIKARCDLIIEYYQARVSNLRSGDSVPYRPVPPDSLFLDEAALQECLIGRAVIDVSPFSAGDAAAGGLDAGGGLGRDFADVRVDPKANLYDAVVRDLLEHAAKGRTVIVVAMSEGSAERLHGLLREHGATLARTDGAGIRSDKADGKAHLVVAGLERGFRHGNLVVITETDILGERMSRPGRRRVRPENFIAEISALGAGDMVVHVDHGIGQFEGLETIAVGGAP